MYMRSADMFLGVPFNIASYALFTHMIAEVTGLGVGELILVIGDAHIYLNHVEQVKEMLSNEPFDLPILELKHRTTIDSFETGDIKIVGYKSHKTIKAPMAV